MTRQAVDAAFVGKGFDPAPSQFELSGRRSARKTGLAIRRGVPIARLARLAVPGRVRQRSDQLLPISLHCRRRVAINPPKTVHAMRRTKAVLSIKIQPIQQA